MRWWAKVRCNFWFYAAVIAHNVFVRPIPNAIWHLQRPGAWAYQKWMGKSYLLSEKYGFGYWKDEGQ